MKVILMSDVPGIGRKDDIKEVKDGYARNFLLPKHLAVEATAAAMSSLEQKRKHEVETHEKDTAMLKEALQEIKKTSITISVKATEKGALFKKIGPKDIASAINKAGFSAITEADILLDEPIKEVGTHAFTIIRGDASAVSKVSVEAKKE